VEQWAEIRRLHFVMGLSIKAICRRTGRSRQTVRRALRTDAPPAYRRAPTLSELEAYKPEIHRLLADEPRLPATRTRELITEQGYLGGRTILEEYLREVRPLFAPPPRTFQRTLYRPGEICQFDLWEPSRPIPVGHDQTRRGRVVVACLGYSRAGAGALVFSKQTYDVLWGVARCLWRLGGLPRTLVWIAKEPFTPGPAARASPSPASAASFGSAGICARRTTRRPRASSSGCRATWRTSFEPGRAFANELDFQRQLDDWFERANRRTHRGLRCRPLDRFPRSARRWARADFRAGSGPADRAAGAARSLRAHRHLRLLARPAPCRPAGRGQGRSERDHRLLRKEDKTPLTMGRVGDFLPDRRGQTVALERGERARLDGPRGGWSTCSPSRARRPI
jgi:hypothetical protein